jgi:hypothetical protein
VTVQQHTTGNLSDHELDLLDLAWPVAERDHLPLLVALARVGASEDEQHTIADQLGLR